MAGAGAECCCLLPIFTVVPALVSASSFHCPPGLEPLSLVSLDMRYFVTEGCLYIIDFLGGVSLGSAMEGLGTTKTQGEQRP